jgi:hypothetical protein
VVDLLSVDRRQSEIARPRNSVFQLNKAALAMATPPF